VQYGPCTNVSVKLRPQLSRTKGQRVVPHSCPPSISMSTICKCWMSKHPERQQWLLAVPARTHIAVDNIMILVARLLSEQALSLKVCDLLRKPSLPVIAGLSYPTPTKDTTLIMHFYVFTSATLVLFLSHTSTALEIIAYRGSLCSSDQVGRRNWTAETGCHQEGGGEANAVIVKPVEEADDDLYAVFFLGKDCNPDDMIAWNDGNGDTSCVKACCTLAGLSLRSLILHIYCHGLGSLLPLLSLQSRLLTSLHLLATTHRSELAYLG
jgi:hypothetical protein